MANLSAHQCCLSDPWRDSVERTASFVVEGVLVPVVGSVGLLGNVLAVAVLSEMREVNGHSGGCISSSGGGVSPFNWLLIILATVDIVLIVFTVADYTMVRQWHVSEEYWLASHPFSLTLVRGNIPRGDASFPGQRVTCVCTL